MKEPDPLFFAEDYPSNCVAQDPIVAQSFV